MEQRKRIVRFFKQLHLPGFHLGEIQYVIDDRKQCPAGALDVQKIFLLPLFMRRPK